MRHLRDALIILVGGGLCRCRLRVFRVLRISTSLLQSTLGPGSCCLRNRRWRGCRHGRSGHGALQRNWLDWCLGRLFLRYGCWSLCRHRLCRLRCKSCQHCGLDNGKSAVALTTANLHLQIAHLHGGKCVHTLSLSLAVQELHKVRAETTHGKAENSPK